MALIHCKGNGILEIGNIKPDNKMVGSIKANSDTIIATCWVSALVEIKIPRLKAEIINNKLSNNNRAKLPFIGISKIKTPINKIKIAFRN